VTKIFRSKATRGSGDWFRCHKGKPRRSGASTYKNLPQQSNSGVRGLVPLPQRKAPPKRGEYILEGKTKRANTQQQIAAVLILRGFRLRGKAPLFRPEGGAEPYLSYFWITRERLARPSAPKITRGAVTRSKKSPGGGSSFDEGQRPSHGSRCGHQYDRGCEHQTQ
jgi:hypothetical protein